MTKIIAELCQNHNGDIKVLSEMVSAASEAGADILKIQSMRSKDLTFRERFEDGLIEGGKIKVIKRPYKAELERLSKLDLDYDLHAKFFELCEKYKVIPMTTIFSFNNIEFLKQFKNLNHIKIASFDCNSHALVKKICKNFKDKKIIISTGTAYNRYLEKEKIINSFVLKKQNNFNKNLMFEIIIIFMYYFKIVFRNVHLVLKKI